MFTYYSLINAAVEVSMVRFPGKIDQFFLCLPTISRLFDLINFSMRIKLLLFPRYNLGVIQFISWSTIHIFTIEI
jgi:hypothetical protein